MMHRSSHLGRVHGVVPKHCQQLLGMVGVLAGDAGPLGLQKGCSGSSYGALPCFLLDGTLASHPHLMTLPSACVSSLSKGKIELSVLLKPEP